SEVVGDWTDRLETARYHGETVLMRTQVESYKDPAQPGTTYMNYFDPKTLRPILSQLTSTSGAGWVREYMADGLTMYVIRPDKPKQEVRAPISQPTFDFFGGMYGLL